MSSFNVIASNINAANPALANQQRMNRKSKLCWKCQKDKQTTGGKLVLKPGLHMFVCHDCMELTRIKKEAE